MSEVHAIGITAAKRYLNEKEVAQLCGWSLSTLRNWRFLGCGPAYCKIGKSVRYLFADFEAFMEQHRVSRDGTH